MFWRIKFLVIGRKSFSAANPPISSFAFLALKAFNMFFRCSSTTCFCSAISCHFLIDILKMRIINFDQPRSRTKHRRIHPAMPEDSFRLVVACPSGSGKTNTLLHMIYNLLHFDEILLFAKNLHQDKYQFLLNDFAKRVDPEAGYQVIVTPPEIIPLNDAFSGNDSQRLVIFDDFVCEKNQNEIINYFINGRNFNCSVIYLSQSFFKVSKNIRDTASHFCVFLFLPKENKRIADDLGVENHMTGDLVIWIFGGINSWALEKST